MGAELPVLPDGWPHTGRREPTCRVTPRINWLSRRDRFEQMWREGISAEEMADFFETDPQTIYSKASRWKLGRRSARGVRGGNPGWPEEKRERFRVLWNGDRPVPEIAQAMGTSRGAIYERARRDSECKKRRRGSSGRRPLTPGETRVRNGSSFRTLPARDATGQRRFTGVTKHEDAEGPRIVLEPHHPAHRKGTTFFPGRVIPAAKMERLLKSGEHSRKLGKIIVKGCWKGMPIYSLTLEERETCPRTCVAWAICYGNNMPFALRILDDGTLTRRLWAELAALSARHPAGFVVRLHVLGDFYSRDYVRFWRESLAEFPALHVFGFTARAPSEPIGGDLVVLVSDEPDRFVIRFSGAGYDTHCAEVVDHPAHAKGIPCPAQTDENRCCATCGLCWQSDRTISFVKH